MLKLYKNKNFGFTLVETLVAISILSLSILGTFTSVQSGLAKSSYAKDQTTAFYLAQEAFEFIQNIRDENALANIASFSSGGTGVNWLQNLNQCLDGGKTCTIDSPQKLFTLCAGGFGNCPNLYQDQSSLLFGYTSTSGWIQTKFRREVQLQTVNSNEIIAKVYISWNTGSLSKTISFMQSIFNIR